jgi:hypothetical protein
MSEISQRYFRPDEAAAYLGIAPAAVRALPDLWQCRLTDRLIRYDLEDLKAYRYKLPLPKNADGLADLIRTRVAEHETVGFIYFMRCREIVKIGYSAEPPSRHAALQAVIPFELELLGSMPGSVAAERDLHKTFSSIKYERHTEWFYHSPELLAAIGAATEACDG